MAQKYARPSPGKGFTARRMGISGDLQAMTGMQKFSLPAERIRFVPLWFSNPPLTEMRRSMRRQVRKEAAKP